MRAETNVLPSSAARDRKATIVEWDRLVAELKRDSTYQKIIEEMNAAYKERQASKQ